MKKGKLIIVSGPSGVGKKTILDQIYSDKRLNIVQSISMTTRKPRNNETDKKDYFFVSKEEFLKNISNNEFLEYAEYNGNYYGTPKKFILEQQELGKNVLLEIETVGVKKIINNNIDTLKIFILPPSIETLKERLLKRGTEDINVIDNRIKAAKEELTLKHLYDYLVINDNLEKAVNDIKNILIKETNDSRNQNI